MAGAQSTKVPKSLLRNAHKTLSDNKVTVYGVGAGDKFNPQNILRTASKGDFIYYNYKYDQVPQLAPNMDKALKAGMKKVSLRPGQTTSTFALTSV